MSRIRLAAVAAGLSTLAVAGLAGPAAADGSYDPGKENCNAANVVTPGSTALVWCIQQAQQSGEAKRKAREDFVKGLLDLLVKQTNGYYNVMIFDIRGNNAFGDPWYVHNYEEHLEDVDFTYDVTYRHQTSREDQTYRIWIFHGGGMFANGFDGGWGNWAFYGLFDRTSREHNWAYPPGTSRPGQRYNHTDAVVNFRRTLTSAVPSGTPAQPGQIASPFVPTVPAVPRGGEPATPGVPIQPGKPAHPGKPGGPAKPGRPSGSGRPPQDTPVYLRTVNGLGAVATDDAPGSTVIADKLGGAGSRWTFKDAGGGRYRITNGLGPELTENTNTYFADVNGWKGSSEQRWEVLSITGDAYRIRISDQDCLTYHADRKTLGVWTCDGSAEQQWPITR
ncbi:hypothetical protein AB0D10_18585 [Kitasatospora sp. NPDC048545]|uniref:RICIN domain-containing protein n=1 Tax=Kitasatospora sp. NPDC048545 TaxID=3157208 RepID=UPI0033D39B8D